MLIGSLPARNALSPVPATGAAEPGEGLGGAAGSAIPESRPRTRSVPSAASGRKPRPARRRIEGQRPLHQHQPGDDETAEENVDALDQQRRTVLQLECGRRGGTQLQHTVAAECRSARSPRPSPGR